MKICFLTTSYPLTHDHFAGNFIRNSALALSRQGHKVEIIAPDDASEPPLYENDNGINVHRFKYFPFRKMQHLAYGNGILPNLKANPLLILQIIPFLLAFRRAAIRNALDADIVHAHWSLSGFAAIACAKRFGTPTVLGLRGSDFSGSDKSITTKITRYFLRNVSAVTTVNEVLHKKALDSGAAPKYCQVIRNGVDTKIFSDKRSKEILRTSAAIDSDLIVLFAGRLTEVKGPDIALKAFESACSKPEIKMHLVYVGGGRMLYALTDRVSATPTLKGRVSFFGEVANSKMANYYQAADVLLISSRAEGLPNSLLEGMSCGLPVVSAPVGGVPEVITDDKTGYLSDDFSPESIGSRLEAAVSDPAKMKQVGQNARDWISANMSWDRHADNLLSFYDRITGDQVK